MRRLITATCLVALLASCSQETVSIEQKADVQENALPKGMVEVDLTKYGIGAQLMVPGKSRTGVDPTISLDEVTSHVNIRSGKNYNVYLREEPMELAMIKDDLANELMFKNEILDERANCLLYKKSLPDGSSVYHHFATVITEGAVTVVIKSDEMGAYSKKQAERMMQSSLTLSMGAPLALK